MSQEIITQEAGHGSAPTVTAGGNNINSMIQVIERVAMNPDVDVEKMEKLLGIQERMLDRQARADFDAAMSEMQTHLPTIAKRGQIVVKGEVRSSFATFEDINDVVKPILSRFGFSMSFHVNQEGGQINVKGVLAHRSGHREETSITLGADVTGSKNAVQAVGSSVSYGKRYVMSALLNLTFRGEDDDGEAAAPRRLVDAKQVSELSRALGQCSEKTREWFDGRYGDISDVPAAQFDALMVRLNEAARKASPGKSSRAADIVKRHKQSKQEGISDAETQGQDNPAH